MTGNVAPEHADVLRDIARYADLALNGPAYNGKPKRWFAILIADFDSGDEPEGPASYVSNLKADALARNMREFADSLEDQ